MPSKKLNTMSAFDGDSGELNVIIETPKGSRNKFDYDERAGLFKLGGVLPSGAVFPFDFGFVPSTVGGDGDPLDVLVLMDEPAFTGCLVRVRLLGVIEAEQTERDGLTTRNDRLVGVASESRLLRRVETLASLGESLLDEIEHFFVSYNDIKGKVFKPLGRFDAAHALRLVKEGREAFAGTHRPRAAKKKGAAKKRGAAKRSRRG